MLKRGLEAFMVGENVENKSYHEVIKSPFIKDTVLYHTVNIACKLTDSSYISRYPLTMMKPFLF